MPKNLEQELNYRAKKLGLNKQKTSAYVFGTMDKVEKSKKKSKK